MRLTLVAPTLPTVLMLLALTLAIAPAVATPTPVGSCYEVLAFADGAPDAVWQGTLHDPTSAGDARFELTRADTGEVAEGSLAVQSVEWTLLLHAATASARAEAWQLAEGATLRFAYAAEDGQPGPATGGGAAGGWTWVATARC